MHHSSDDRLRALAFSASTAGIVVSDPTQPDDPIVEVNPAFERMTGYTREEVLGRNCRFLQGPDTDPAAVSSIRDALAADEDVNAELLNYRKDGTPFWMELRVTSVHDEAGVVVNPVGVQVDVTERRRLDDELVAATKAAQQADQLKSAFLSAMSHELRTPLNAIIGYAHLLLDGMAGDLSPAQSEDIGHIARGADRLLALINDVLDLSRLDAGMLEIARDPVRVTSLFEQVVADLAPLAAIKGIRLDAEAPADLVVVADPLRLHQVMLNLAGNAVKFTERGEVTLAARVIDGTVELSVRDTGIDADALPHVFDEFRQASSGTTRKYGGTGLGLAITRRLVEMHGGTISVGSERGVGSSFTVTLPLR